MSSFPKFSYYFRMFAGERILCIVDDYDKNTPTRTVTNSAGWVLSQIVKESGLLPKIIIYKDSEGRWDRIEADRDGNFLRFLIIAPGIPSPTDEDEALQLAVLSPLLKENAHETAIRGSKPKPA